MKWRIPRQGGMRVDGIVYASAALMADLREDPSLTQVANVAHLPGILGASLAMPDIHWGYGFPIGGVAATNAEEGEEGVVSPGGVGYDINCGVRLLRSALPAEEVRPRISEVVSALYENVPTGAGTGRRDLKLGKKGREGVLETGARWAVERGLGVARDLESIEEGGVIQGADVSQVTGRACARGAGQLGSLGSGNHFAEIQVVSEIYDETA